VGRVDSRLSLFGDSVNVCARLVHGLLASRLALSLNRPNKHPHEPHHLGGSSGASKMISEPMVHLAQIVDLSNTVSKPK
jgi:hypothetical protein